jgi:hypothetical protein
VLDSLERARWGTHLHAHPTATQQQQQQGLHRPPCQPGCVECRGGSWADAVKLEVTQRVSSNCYVACWLTLAVCCLPKRHKGAERQRFMRALCSDLVIGWWTTNIAFWGSQKAAQAGPRGLCVFVCTVGATGEGVLNKVQSLVNQPGSVCACVRVCGRAGVCACVRAGGRACGRACVRACV